MSAPVRVRAGDECPVRVRVGDEVRLG